MKPSKSLTKRVFSLVLALFVLLSGSAWAAGDGDSTTVTGTYGQTEARTMLNMVNNYRTSAADAWYYNADGSKFYCTGSNALQPLTYDYKLEQYAMQRAAELVVSYSHIRPNGELPNVSLVKGYSPWAENIAMGSIYDSAKKMMGVETTFNSALPEYEDYGWMETNESYWNQGHRRTILNKNVTAIGCAHFIVGDTHYWVQEFGNPNSGAAATAPNDAEATVQVPLKPSGSGGSESGGGSESDGGESYQYELVLTDVSVNRKSKKQTARLVLPDGCSLSYKSSDKKKVSVNKSGKITIAANYVGVVTIQVTGTRKGMTVKPTSFKVKVRPEAPKLPGLTVKKRKITAEWTRVKNVDGYEVQYSTDWDFKTRVAKKKLKGSKKLTHSAKMPKKGSYYVGVRSYKKVGNTTVYSLWRQRSIQVK